jgi:hypothetical protein
MKVRFVNTVTTTNSAGQVVESIPVYQSDDPVVIAGVPVAPIDIEEDEFYGAPVRIVSDLVVQNSIGQPVQAIPVSGGGSYDPDALAFFDRLTTPPTDERKALYNTLVVDLKSAGVWEKLDALYILAAADAQAARRNLVQDAYNLTAAGAPTFTADRGYQGDASGAYLATGFTPSTAISPRYIQNSASMGSWSRTNNTGINYCDIGVSAANAIIASVRPSAFGGPFTVASNCTSANLSTAATASSVGLSAWSRSGPSAVSLYRNGSLSLADTKSSGGVPNNAITLLSAGGAQQFSANQLSFAFIGGALTDTEQTTLYASLDTFRIAVGA